MARYTGPSCKLCRREGAAMYLKGEKCYTKACPFLARPYAPGQHGQGRKKASEYAGQLRAKQKAKRYYGLLEKQFSKYFVMANKMKQGIKGENLLKLLESRLDNVIYRLGFAASRRQARQFVTHKFFTVNGKPVNIPSYLVSEGDEIGIVPKVESKDFMKEILNANASRVAPAWLEKSPNKGKVIRLAERSEIDLEVAEHLIVELYSK